MYGPFDLVAETIESVVEKDRPGNYALGYLDTRDRFVVCYIGRSDTCVQTRIADHAGETTRLIFVFNYATSINAAYEKECTDYHEYDPPDNIAHPAHPKDSLLRCPVCGR